MSPLKNFVVLFIVLAVAISKSHGFEVYISNVLGAGVTLTAHCWSSTTDLGSHVIVYQGFFTWDFSIDIGSEASYDCDLSYYGATVGGHGHFNLFNERRDAVRCGDERCLWRVVPDGLYLYIKANNAYEKQFHW